MSKKPYAYIINDEFYVFVDNGQILRIANGNKSKFFGCLSVSLSAAGMSLLSYLLQNGMETNQLSREKIMTENLDKQYAYPSSQKLWTLIQEIGNKLACIGGPKDLFKSSRKNGIEISSCKLDTLYIE